MKDWIPAGATRNWCQRNELLDWLDEYGGAQGFARDSQRAGYDERLDFGQWISRQGRRFEEAVLSHLANTVALTRLAQQAEPLSLEAAEETRAAMAQGVSAIAGGVLHDSSARMYGAPDLLIRSDVLAQLCPAAFPEGDDPSTSAPGLTTKSWHYRVVDIKYTTLALLSAGTLSTSEQLAAMAQVWAYNAALGRVQGFTPPSGYVLGRAWRHGKLRGQGCWERLGLVPHDAMVKSLDLPLGAAVAAGAEWVRRVRNEGDSWEVLPVPSVAELWPNMRESSDGSWHTAKVEIARELGELTLLRTVNPGHRRNAHELGVTRWDDERVTAELLGITRDADVALLNAILEVHRSSEAVHPARIAADSGNWRERGALELYVDFETVNDLDDDFSGFPKPGGQALIFQVGCGRYDDQRWTFRQFTARALTLEAEAEMLEEWLRHVRELALEAGLDSPAAARIFHWSAAETISMNSDYGSARARHSGREWPELGWYDILRKVVQVEPVVIKGSMAFGLKAVARALHAHGLIATQWGEGLADGTGAMAGAWTSAAEAKRVGCAMTEIPLMRDIDRYNEIDCRVMAEVLDYLRREH